MKSLKTSASGLLVDLETRVHSISREVGLGVIEALDERQKDEPGARAEQLALGFMRGIHEGMQDVRHHKRIEEIAEEAARAFARGALATLRAQLGETGEGSLTQSLGTSAHRVASAGASALVTPFVFIGVAAAVGLASTLVLLRLKRT
jgi:hypothetical protein